MVIGLLASLVAGALLALAAVSEDAGVPSEVSARPPRTAQATLDPPAGDALVELEDGGVHPTRLRLRPGQEFGPLVQNSSTTEHHFIVDPLGIHEDLQPGSSARVIVSDPRRGTYRSWCAFGGHPERITFVVA